MGTLKLKATRNYPSIPAVTGDVQNHTLVLSAIREALETGQRRTNDLLNSFVRVQELIDLGLVALEGNSSSIIGSVATGGSTVGALNDLTDVIISTPLVDQFLRYNGTQWINAPLADADITETMVTQHEAALSIDYSQLTGTIPSALRGYPPALGHSGI